MLLTTLLLSASLATPVPATAELEWFDGPFMSALGAAKHEEKPILVYFWSGQSEQCARIWQETLSKPECAAVLDDFVLVSADTADKAGYALVERFGVKTLPTLLVVDSSGQADDAILGHIGLEGLADEVGRIERGEGTVTALRSTVQASPDDIDARMALAIKLGDVGNRDGYEAERATMYDLDPQFAHLATAKMRLWQWKEEAQSSEEAIASFDAAPVAEFVAKSEHGEIRFAGHGWLAGLADYREDAKAGRAHRVALWQDVPESAVAQEGFSITRRFYEEREELSRKEKTFALDVAKATLASVQSWSTKPGCGEGCECGGCTEGCIGDEYGSERLVKRELYVARAYEALACAYELNGKKKDAMAAIDASLQLDPENEVYQSRRASLKKRG